MATQIGALTLGNGVNLQPSYYNGGNVTFGWNFMHAHPLIKSVRIEIEPGRADEAIGWIAQAKAHNLQIVATYHKKDIIVTDNDAQDVMDAANWWVANYARFGGGFLINLVNEWGDHDISADDYAAAYNPAIAALRAVYHDAVIIDLPGWGQEVHTAVSAIPLINDADIVLSAHIYKSSNTYYTHAFLTPADLDEMDGCGKPCIVGEFGNQGDGDCDWSACVDSAKTRGWTVIGWCWNGDGEGHNMVSPFWGVNANPAAFTEGPYFNTIYDKLQPGV